MTVSTAWRRAHAYRGTAAPARRLGRHSTVVDAFAAVAARTPDAPFLNELRDAAVTRTLSYGEMRSKVLARAGALGRLGVGPGTRLGLRPDNDIDAFATILSTLWVGATAVLANPRDAGVRVREQFSRVEAIDYRELAETVRGIETTDPRPPAPPAPAARPDDVAVVVFTSGSTGLPRAVAQSHYSIAVNCAAVAAHHGLTSGRRLLACLPLFHVNALEFTGFAAMVSGCSVFLLGGFDPLSYPRSLAASRAEIASVVPSILTALTAGRHAERPATELRYFVSAAAPLAAETVRRAGERLNARVVQGYGLSEAANFSCLMPVDLDRAAYARLMTEAEIPAVGHAVAGNEVDVVRDDDSSADDGEVGEVVIRGHNVMDGYLGDVEATEAAFRGGWLRTGDLGRKVRDSAVGSPVFVITGRAKHVVKVGGHAVGLEEVERALLAVDGIVGVAACAVPDRRSGEALAVMVVTAAAGVDAQVVRAAVRDRIGPDQVPQVVRFVNQIPLLANGKIARRAVTEALAGPTNG